MRNTWILLSIIFLAGCDSLLGTPATGPLGVKQGTNHRVRQGETLYALAEEAYGNGMEWHLIWSANEWIHDPDRTLRVGEIIYIPARDPALAQSEPRGVRSANPPTGVFDDGSGEDFPTGNVAANPGRGTATPGGLAVFRNMASTVSTKTVFGVSLEKAFLYGFAGFLGHAIFQGILVWLAANITFVKEASLKKSLKAVFLAESLTFATLLVLLAVGVVMIYLGSEPTTAGGSQLFPALEGYLRSPIGLGIAGFALLALYVTLSLRFLPQVFGIPMGRAMALMAISILLPHLAGAYLAGQRAGILQ